MKEELQRKYESYIALRRRKIYNFFFLILLFWFTTFWIFFIIFGGITGFGVWLIIAIILIAIAKKYPSPPIQPQENEMFLKTCDTLRNIEFYFEDPKSEIHLERARKKLGELISVIRSIQHVRTSYSTIIQKAVEEPLERLSNNLERRVLPLVRHSDNLKDVKEGYSD